MSIIGMGEKRIVEELLNSSMPHASRPECQIVVVDKLQLDLELP